MKFFYLFFAAVTICSCTANSPQISQNANPTEAQRTERPETTTAHTTENQPLKADPNADKGGKWSQSGDPIDTAKFDGAIAQAEKAIKSKPADEAAKKALAQAYFDRAFALTEARQYASALGDYRRALKLDPTHEESKKWIDQIINIYAMLKKEYPKEGEEPPPLKAK
jgi:tetratricopeptide (TPR) repeat protein